MPITQDLAQSMDDYIDDGRKPMTGKYDREPLFTASHGRMSRGRFRSIVCRVTAPCLQNKSCERCNRNDSTKCLNAVSPHAIRRGSITHFLTEDVPIEIVGDRMDVSRRVLKKHYDNVSSEEGIWTISKEYLHPVSLPISSW